MNIIEDTKEIADIVKSITNILSPVVDAFENYTWSGKESDQFWELIQRSSVIRQYEAINAILQMTTQSNGHFGVTFLRAAFEELIWLDYLKKNNSLANEFARLKASCEIADSLEVQNQYLVAKNMQAVGFTQKFVKQYLARNRESNSRLKAIGRELKWRDGETFPSAAFIAKNVGRERDYKFIYHASSRYVHFSPHELVRRVWGQKGHVNISSKTFSKYWTFFALYWSVRIFLQTLSATQLEWHGFIDDTQADLLLEKLKELHPVEIVTRTELYTWKS